jgi:hypothetical protein
MCTGGVVSQCWTVEINRGSYLQFWFPPRPQTYDSLDVSEEVKEWFTLIPMFAYLDNMRYVRWGEVLNPRQFPLTWRERIISYTYYGKEPKRFFNWFYHSNLVGMWYTPAPDSADNLGCSDWWGVRDISPNNEDLRMKWWGNPPFSSPKDHLDLYYLTAKYIANERRWVFYVFVVKVNLNLLFGERTPPYMPPPPSLGLEDLQLVWDKAEERILYFYDSELYGLVSDMYVYELRYLLTVSADFIMFRASRTDNYPIILSPLNPSQNAFAVAYLWWNLS